MNTSKVLIIIFIIIMVVCNMFLLVKVKKLEKENISQNWKIESYLSDMKKTNYFEDIENRIENIETILKPKDRNMNLNDIEVLIQRERRRMRSEIEENLKYLNGYDENKVLSELYLGNKKTLTELRKTLAFSKAKTK